MKGIVSAITTIALLISLAVAQSTKQAGAKSDNKKSVASGAMVQSAAPNTVGGSGTPGRLSKWVGTSGSSTFVLGDTNITEDKFGQVGIGTTAPTSLLTVQGMIETTLGGYKFPDGTVQATALSANQVVSSLNNLKGNVTLAAGANITITPGGNTLTIAAPNALSAVAHETTLQGNGTSASPLGVAVPLHLSGATQSGQAALLRVTNTGNQGTGIFAQGGDLAGGPGFDRGGFGLDGRGGQALVASGIGGDGVSATGGDGSTRGGEGVSARGGLSVGGVAGDGVLAEGATSSGAGAGAGVRAQGGSSGTHSGGDGVVATGGTASGPHFSDRGGSGVRATGGDGDSQFGGEGVSATGGRSTTGLPGTGVVAFGGTRVDGNQGGIGIESQGGNGNFGGDGLRTSGGSASGAGHTAGDGLRAFAGQAFVGATPGRAGVFEGDVLIDGELNVTGTKNFKIDHPLDPENKYLLHAAIESSEVLNIYSGNITTDANGQATVTLPNWFEALNRDVRYQLTVIGTFAQAIVAEKVRQNRFRIKTNAPNTEVSWQVTGVRSDAVMLKHPFKPEEEKPEREHGPYLSPEAYGQPEDRNVEWARHPELMSQVKNRRGQITRKTQGNNP